MNVFQETKLPYVPPRTHVLSVQPHRRLLANSYDYINVDEEYADDYDTNRQDIGDEWGDGDFFPNPFDIQLI